MVLLILGDRNLHNELQQLPSSQPANRFRPREQGNKYLFFKCVEQWLFILKTNMFSLNCFSLKNMQSHNWTSVLSGSISFGPPGLGSVSRCCGIWSDWGIKNHEIILIRYNVHNYWSNHTANLPFIISNFNRFCFSCSRGSSGLRWTFSAPSTC